MVTTDCIFCNIVNGQMEAATIFENSEFKVILDRFPASKGHTLILPKEHVETIFDLDTETISKLFALAAHVAKVLKQKYNCEGLNLLQNNGAAAGQTVNHFHLHLIPRFEGDNVTIHWKTLDITEEELNEIADEVGKAI
ncbi:MAG: HIT family protein [Eubacteriales bacterium]